MSAHRSCSLTMAQFRKHFCINCPLSTEQGLSAGRRYLKLVITTAGSDFLALLITGPHTVLLKSSQGIVMLFVIKGKKRKHLRQRRSEDMLPALMRHGKCSSNTATIT